MIHDGLTALIDVPRERSPDAFRLRPAAATALGRIGQPVERVVSALTDALRSKPRDMEIIEPAVRALGRIGPGSVPAIPTLLKTLESPLTFDGAAIRAALVQIGPTATEAATNRSEELLKEVGQSDTAKH